ncbi:MAG: translation elongation factor 4 [bacterium]
MIEKIRNFSIIAHIDHGKSTLADRMLELTKTITSRQMREQFLDTMDLERERGITIKLKPIQMHYQDAVLNLIDTPGHVDFYYEVSRSLAAVEGVILVVDATQGVEAQTVANLYLALEQNLIIIPVVNKIDLAAAQVAKVKTEISKLIGVAEQEILEVSAKTGKGVAELLAKIISDIPAPKVGDKSFDQALIFDSQFDDYQGVINSIRVVTGEFHIGQEVKLIATGEKTKVLELGHFLDKPKADKVLSAGEIGYIITGIRDVKDTPVGDTVTSLKNPSPALPGYKKIKPMVYASLYSKNGDEFAKLRESLQKLQLNDAALNFEPEHSPALGHGFRCGFLGMLHMEVIEERIKREFDVEVIITVPTVAYRAKMIDSSVIEFASPLEFPNSMKTKILEEPWMELTIVTPSRYVGAIMTSVNERRGTYQNTEYLDADRIVLHYQIPLASLIVDFHDKLKSVSQGYASMNYEMLNYRKTDLVRLDIQISQEPVEALSSIVYKEDVYSRARRIVDTLKEVLTRQQFEIKIQALLSGRIIASSRIAPLRKDVTAKLYGGDVTRKRKLLDKQKKGKKRMKTLGRVAIPASAFIKLLRR